MPTCTKAKLFQTFSKELEKKSWGMKEESEWVSEWREREREDLRYEA